MYFLSITMAVSGVNSTLVNPLLSSCKTEVNLVSKFCRAHVECNLCNIKQTTNKHMKKILKITAALLSMGYATFAQSTSSTAPQRVTLAVDDILDLTWKSGSGTAQTFNFSNLNDYINGKESTEQEFRVVSNKKFKIEVKTTSANLSDGGSNQMPVADHLKMIVTSNSTGSVAGGFGSNYTNLSNVAQQVITAGQPGTPATPEQSFKVRYKAIPGTSYPKANYSVDVIFTATHQ